MIESVDCIHTELELISICPDVECLAGRQIEDDLARTVDIVPVVIAESTGGGCRESSRVEPLCDGTRSGAGISYLVRIPATRLRVGVVCSRYCSRDWISCLQNIIRRYLPTANSLVDVFILVQERFTHAEREQENGIPFEGITDIEVRCAVVCVDVIGTLVGLVTATAAPRRGVVLIHEVRPHITARK